MISDLVRAVDTGAARLRNRAGEILQEAAWALLGEDDLDKPVVEVNGWVRAVIRERGKLLRETEGHNVWTNTGREYLAMLTGLKASDGSVFRDDRIAYIGVGTGFQVEAPAITALANPVAYLGSDFLAPLVAPPTFPLAPTRTTIRFHRVFTENEITTTPASRVSVSEMGLFTNGSPSAVPAYAAGSRSRTLATASAQAPAAYKSFSDPLVKTDALQLELYWEVRF